ncbi:MAG: hypothetical protein U0350_27420 [Caldilineaceae bacterium]
MVRRTNRQLTRLYFILVLVMAFFGGWYADRNWQPDFSHLGQKPVVENGNWIDFFSALGEETIQLFLGLTTPSK